RARGADEEACTRRSDRIPAADARVRRAMRALRRRDRRRRRRVHGRRGRPDLATRRRVYGLCSEGQTHEKGEGTMTETQQVQGTETVEVPRAERVAKLVAQLGAGWARYGLTMGRIALQHSARVLEG